MLPAGGRLATSWVHYTTTQSSAPEDGQNNCPKHVELTGIINKPLLLHIIGCIYYLYHWCMVKQISDNEIYLLIKYIKSVLLRGAKRLSYIEDAWCLKVKYTEYKLKEVSNDNNQVSRIVDMSMKLLCRLFRLLWKSSNRQIRWQACNVITNVRLSLSSSSSSSTKYDNGFCTT
jgi:hypothetical protein